MEAKAILEGIKAISQTCIQKKIPLEVEIDPLVVVNVLNGEELSNEAEAICWIHPPHLNELGIYLFLHDNRLANPVPHWLARKASSIDFGFGYKYPHFRDCGHIFWAPNLPLWFSPPI